LLFVAPAPACDRQGIKVSNQSRSLQVVPVEAANTAEVMEKYTASPQVCSIPFPPLLRAVS
jgi:hypothetical protein